MREDIEESFNLIVEAECAECDGVPYAVRGKTFSRQTRQTIPVTIILHKFNRFSSRLSTADNRGLAHSIDI